MMDGRGDIVKYMESLPLNLLYETLGYELNPIWALVITSKKLQDRF
jgi:hypothetical protein